MGYKLDRLDRKVAEHLLKNGKILDPVGIELTVMFVREALNDPAIKEMARQYDFTFDDLCRVYTAMVQCLMPNPLVRDGSGTTLLVASLHFMESFRIGQLMAVVDRKLPTLPTDNERHAIICEVAEEFAILTWAQHTAQRGKASFEILPFGNGLKSAHGCGCLVVFAFLGGGGVAYELLQAIFA